MYKKIIALGLMPFLLCAEERLPDYIHAAAGAFSYKKERFRAFEGHVEYRWNWDNLAMRPLVALMATSKGTVHGYAGIALELIERKFYGAFSFAPGLYYKGRGKELGWPIEFRTAIEIGWILPKDYRISLQFYHISNASMGFKNPGQESLLLCLQIPIYRCKKR